VKSLPGSPDIVLPKYRTAIFVHGCFWHRHQGCKQGSYFPKDPRQGVEFWQAKFDQNVQRDKRHIAALISAGWKVFVVWECETRDEGALDNLLSAIME